MEVVSVAVEDTVFDAQGFRDTLSGAVQGVVSNLSQVIAVGGLCNSAVFGGKSVDGSPRPVMGNQTGKWRTSDFTIKRISSISLRRCRPTVLS